MSKLNQNTAKDDNLESKFDQVAEEDYTFLWDVNTEKMQLKLAKSLLADPYEYALETFMTVYNSNPSTIKVKSNKTKLEIQGDGEGISLEDIDSIMASSVTGFEDNIKQLEKYQGLSTAIYSSLNTGVEKITIESKKELPEKEGKINFEESRYTITVLDEDNITKEQRNKVAYFGEIPLFFEKTNKTKIKKGLKISFQKEETSLSKTISNIIHRQFHGPEYEKIIKRCKHSLIPVQLNGREITTLDNRRQLKKTNKNRITKISDQNMYEYIIRNKKENSNSLLWLKTEFGYGSFWNERKNKKLVCTKSGVSYPLYENSYNFNQGIKELYGVIDFLDVKLTKGKNREIKLSGTINKYQEDIHNDLEKMYLDIINTYLEMRDEKEDYTKNYSSKKNISSRKYFFEKVINNIFDRNILRLDLEKTVKEGLSDYEDHGSISYLPEYKQKLLTEKILKDTNGNNHSIEEIINQKGEEGYHQNTVIFTSKYALKNPDATIFEETEILTKVIDNISFLNKKDYNQFTKTKAQRELEAKKRAEREKKEQLEQEKKGRMMARTSVRKRFFQQIKESILRKSFGDGEYEKVSFKEFLGNTSPTKIASYVIGGTLAIGAGLAISPIALVTLTGYGTYKVGNKYVLPVAKTTTKAIAEKASSTIKPVSEVIKKTYRQKINPRLQIAKKETRKTIEKGGELVREGYYSLEDWTVLRIENANSTWKATKKFTLKGYNFLITNPTYTIKKNTLKLLSEITAIKNSEYITNWIEQKKLNSEKKRIKRHDKEKKELEMNEEKRLQRSNEEIKLEEKIKLTTINKIAPYIQRAKKVSLALDTIKNTIPNSIFHEIMYEDGYVIKLPSKKRENNTVDVNRSIVRRIKRTGISITSDTPEGIERELNKYAVLNSKNEKKPKFSQIISSENKNIQRFADNIEGETSFYMNLPFVINNIPKKLMSRRIKLSSEDIIGEWRMTAQGRPVNELISYHNTDNPYDLEILRLYDKLYDRILDKNIYNTIEAYKMGEPEQFKKQLNTLSMDETETVVKSLFKGNINNPELNQQITKKYPDLIDRIGRDIL